MTDELKKMSDDLAELQKKIHEGAMFVIGNTKDITALQEWQVRQNGTLNEIKECLDEIKGNLNALQLEDITNLRLEMAKGKPSWGTLFIISFLSSVTVGAVVFSIRMGVSP